MEFKIGDFIVYTNKKVEEFGDQIAVPTKLRNGKPSDYRWEYKTRDLTVFYRLNLLEKKDGKYYGVIHDLFDFIDLIEVLKAFNGNKLNTEKEYNISDKFTAEIVQQDGNITLKIHFKNYSNSLYLDKFECSSLAAKFSKILQKCEPWQELDQ